MKKYNAKRFPYAIKLGLAFALLFVHANTAQAQASSDSILLIASRAAKNKGYRLADFGEPKVSEVGNREHKEWQISWPQKIGNGSDLKVLVNPISKSTTVCPIGFFKDSDNDQYLATDIPMEIRSFIEEGATAIELESNDLNGDGIVDYLLVTDKNDDRELYLLTGTSNGGVVLAGKSRKIVGCRACGGTTSDGFKGITTSYMGFTVENGGSDAASNTSEKFSFNYFSKDNDIFLKTVEIDGATYTYPADFGKTTLNSFDKMYRFIGK